MQCPYCQNADSKVVETREHHGENATRRRRECTGCSERFTTYERVEPPAVTVVKRDGAEERFDRDKIRTGIERSFKKIDAGADQVDRIVADVEAEIRRTGSSSITTAEIGDMVMDRLKDADKVAYIRFASIYRSFDDLSSFEEEVETLKNTTSTVDHPHRG